MQLADSPDDVRFFPTLAIFSNERASLPNALRNHIPRFGQGNHRRLININLVKKWV
jgi:hypothetical protein